jgi:hypothetical protein
LPDPRPKKSLCSASLSLEVLIVALAVAISVFHDEKPVRAAGAPRPGNLCGVIVGIVRSVLGIAVYQDMMTTILVNIFTAMGRNFITYVMIVAAYQAVVYHRAVRERDQQDRGVDRRDQHPERRVRQRHPLVLELSQPH